MNHRDDGALCFFDGAVDGLRGRRQLSLLRVILRVFSILLCVERSKRTSVGFYRSYSCVAEPNTYEFQEFSILKFPILYVYRTFL